MSPKPEFSRSISIDGISPDKIRTEMLEANNDECAALARRFEIRAVSGLKARLAIRRVTGGTIVKVDGEIEADVVQSCVVSLQDVHDHIKAKFETFFTEGNQQFSEDVEFSPDEDDPPEVITNGQIDLGEVVAQYLSLELNPYPKAPGVSLPAQLKAVGMEVKNNPFAVLETLKDKKD